MNAGFGSILSFGSKWQGEDKVTVKGIDDFPEYETEPWNQSPLMRYAYDVLSSADMVVTFFGKGFDWKYLQTVMLKTDRLYLPPIPHVDLYFIGKHRFLIGRGSMAAAEQYFELEKLKTHLEPERWRKAMMGSQEDIDYIKHHNVNDVKLTEILYDLWKPLMTQHPRLRAGNNRCRVCGGKSFQFRGTQYTTNGVAQKRVQCNDCHAWGFIVDAE